MATGSFRSCLRLAVQVRNNKPQLNFLRASNFYKELSEDNSMPRICSNLQRIILPRSASSCHLSTPALFHTWLIRTNVIYGESTHPMNSKRVPGGSSSGENALTSSGTRTICVLQGEKERQRDKGTASVAADGGYFLAGKLAKGNL